VSQKSQQVIDYNKVAVCQNSVSLTCECVFGVGLLVCGSVTTAFLNRFEHLFDDLRVEGCAAVERNRHP
jgi:hypothetical protein